MKKLPVGQQSFEDLINDQCIYIDKTKYIHRMMDSGSRYYFLSRPRRFGKSLLLSTIKAAFEGKKELFKGLYIEDKIEWDQQYPVILLDMSAMATGSAEDFVVSIADELKLIGRRHGITLSQENPIDIFKNLINNIGEKTGKQVVLLVDEYDKPILDAIDDKERATAIRSFLQNFYTIIKSYGAHLRFVLLTGVSKINQVSIFSGLNNLNDITLDVQYAGICGYTQQELEKEFKEYLELLSAKFEHQVTAMLDRIKFWYDGYSWDGHTFMYNPYSVLLLFQKNRFLPFWFNTGTPTFLLKLLKKKDNLETILQEEISVSLTFTESQALEYLDTVALMFQTGYLTIKSFDEKKERYILTLPNAEVKRALSESLLIDISQQSNSKVQKLVENIKDGFSAGDTAWAIENLDILLANTTSNTHQSNLNESHF